MQSGTMECGTMQSSTTRCNTRRYCPLAPQVGYGFLNDPSFNDDGAPGWDALPFALSYTLLLNLIISSIVSGIIIDTFSALRQENDAAVDDMKDKWYVALWRSRGERGVGRGTT